MEGEWNIVGIVARIRDENKESYMLYTSHTMLFNTVKPIASIKYGLWLLMKCHTSLCSSKTYASDYASHSLIFVKSKALVSLTEQVFHHSGLQ